MNLKEIRVSRKLKVQEVSDYLCCLPSVYSRYENGKREPSIDILLKLSKLYGVSVDCLIGNDEVVDTSITEKEAAMISAMRQADERARQDMIPICFEKCARLEWKVPFTNTTQMSELSRLNGYGIPIYRSGS